MLREALRALLPNIQPGWNVILIARTPILTAKLTEIQETLRQLFAKAELIITTHGN